MVPASTTGSPNDAFARVSAALLAVWPQVGDQSAGLSARERSLVLDECGSDHLPLVELLLDIGRHVRPLLIPLAGVRQDASRWANTRAPLVHRLVATRYLQPDVVRWAVDVWGRALGVAPPPEPPVLTTADEASASPAASTMGAATRTRRAPAAAARPTVVTPAQVPAALRTLPSWAGGPVSPRVGTRPSALASTGRLVVVSASPSGPRYQPAERRAAVVFAALLIIITIAMSQALRGRADAPSAASRPDDLPLPIADTLVPSPPVATAATPAPTLTPVPIESASVMVALDTTVATGLAIEAGAAGLSLIDRGVGGRYLVTPRVRDVSGTESCEAVAQALTGGRETVEVVVHQPGASTFVLSTREVSGTLASDGWFTSVPRSGTTNNVNWQFRMRGRFGPDGFSAVSETYTEAILRWGRTQNCVVTADLSGRRLPG